MGDSSSKYIQHKSLKYIYVRYKYPALPKSAINRASHPERISVRVTLNVHAAKDWQSSFISYPCAKRRSLQSTR